MEALLWNTSRPLKPETFATAQRTADAANARPLASLLARPAAASLISSARARRKASNKGYLPDKSAAAFGGIFVDFTHIKPVSKAEIK